MINHILAVIEQEQTKSISFSRFMELALYHPDEGYYTKQKEKIGKSGDFYTSSSVSPIFAEMLSSVFIKLIKSEEVPPIIIELGGGNGTFAKQIVETWRIESLETFKIGQYIIVETSPYHRSLIQDKVKEYENVLVVESLKDIQENNSSLSGIIFSNEFFDAFPIDCIKKVNGELMELRIVCDVDELKVSEFPLTNRNILSFLEEYNVHLTEGQTYEIPISMCTYVEELGRLVDKGVIFTIDYGYQDEEWKLPYHKDGSLRGYFQHQLIEDPLKYVGEMDLTTHIHFDKLIKAGQKSELDFYGLYRQDEFLLKTGILEKLEEHAISDPFSEASKRNRAIRSLVMQGGISSSFHVIVQTKNIKSENLASII